MRQILPTIVVIGFMGAGKTSVGRLVARAFGREFVDTDLMIERAAHMTIAELFQREGELELPAARWPPSTGPSRCPAG